MLVIAKQDGFFGGSRRRAGSTFNVPEGMKAQWFEPAVEKTVRRAIAASEAGQPGGKGTLLTGKADDLA